MALAAWWGASELRRNDGASFWTRLSGVALSKGGGQNSLESGRSTDIDRTAQLSLVLSKLSVEELASRFLDRTRPWAERQLCAQRLAGLRTLEALQALRLGFRFEEGENRRFLARLMVETGDSLFEECLTSLLETGDDHDASVAISGLAAIGGQKNRARLAALMEDDAWPDPLRTEAALALLASGSEAELRSAIHGLAAIGGEPGTEKLAEIARSTEWPEGLRLDAALGLGQIHTPHAGDALIAVFRDFSDPEIQAQLLDCLGGFDFPQIEATWRELLENTDTPDSVRRTAVEALANSSREAAPFIQTIAGSDRDPNVREMAAWALSAHGPDGALGPALAEMSRTEAEPDVRRRLYEALSAQAQNPSDTLLPLIQSETDLAARIAGFNAIGDAVQRNPSSTLAAEFDRSITPELIQIAQMPGSLNLRMRAVFALRRASTPSALNALAEITWTPTQAIAQAARNGLPPTTQNNENDN